MYQIIFRESERSLHVRFMEHRRVAKNPLSDPENAIGQHFLTKHLGQQAMLSNRHSINQRSAKNR